MNRREFLTLYIGMILAFIVGAATGVSTAHTPCEKVRIEPECGYELRTNPYTGELESMYICE